MTDVDPVGPAARDPLAEVFARHRDELATLVDTVRRGVDGDPDVATATVVAATHRLVGSLGTLGFAEASEAAARLETDFRGDGDARDTDARRADVAVMQEVFTPAPIAWTVAPPPTVPEPVPTDATVLVVDDDPVILQTFAPALAAAGFDVVTAGTGREALTVLEGTAVDLIVSDVNMPDMGGFELARALRDDPRTIATPLVFATTRGSRDDIVTGLGLGADDYLVKPVDPVELVARVRARLTRAAAGALQVEPGPAPPDRGAVRADTIVDATAMRRVLDRELARVTRGGRAGAAARMELVEVDDLRHRLGTRSIEALLTEVRTLVRAFLRPADVATVDRDGAVTLFFADLDPAAAEGRIRALSQAVVVRRFAAGGEPVRLTPAIGWADLDGAADTSELLGRVELAAAFAAARLDLQPERWNAGLEPRPAMQKPSRGLGARLRTPVQIVVTLLLGLVVPFVAYWALAESGHDITPVMYLIVVISLALTGAFILLEGLFALRATYPPGSPPTEYPPATAIIAAYLPNEAPTLMETLEAFRRIDYPHLKVILAYNTPHPLPIEAELREFERRWPELMVLRVEGSTSKAQNVNAAMSHVEGEMVALFDADHHPDRHVFRRAWQWLSNGYDVVQGHAVVRNGSASRVARTVAVEFEAIYAVSHPGRARMHGFGIFGGSNGYWRTEVLRTTRMQGKMLTEDIDSALRVVEQGAKIASDRAITSRELATTTMNALWNQRMRWAQGWFQVSLRHTGAMVNPRSALNLRQRFGYWHLLVWREVYPWISLQMFPIIAYWLFVDRPLDWKVPIFVMTTMFTLSVGPLSTLFAYRVGDPEVKANRRWFVYYFFIASLVYTEYKNTIARVAQIKEAMGDRQWVVTPRTASAGGSSGPPEPGGVG